MASAAFKFLLFIHFWGNAEDQRCEAHVAALRAAGHPVRYEDLETPKIPDAENGAKLAAAAHRMLVQRKGTEPFPFDWSVDTDALREMEPEEREGRRAYLRSLQPYFDLLAEVGTRPGWRVEFKDGGLPGDFWWYRDASRYLEWRVALDPEDQGRAESAAEATLVLIGIGERCRMPGVIGDRISRLLTSTFPARILRTACGTPSTTQAVHPGLDATKFRRLVDGRLAKAMQAKGPARTAFAEERVWFIWLVDALRAGEKTEIDRYLPLNGRLYKSRLYRPLLCRDANRVLDILEEAIALADTTPEEAVRAAEKLRAKYGTKDPTQPLAQGVAETVSVTFDWFAKRAAAQRLTRVVMALLEYRQLKGAWPENLDALGDMPLDPYSGKPFVYEHIEGSHARIRAAKRIPDVRDEWEALESDELAWTFKD